MRSVVPDYLTDVLADVESDTSGELPGYIPELATADPERLAAVFAMVDGTVHGAGDVDAAFTIQSISKPFVYAMALSDRGFNPVLAKVGVEPSGEAFNEISLEHDTGRPRNPMINAGAITAHSLAGPENLKPVERVDRVVQGLSAFAGRQLKVDETVCASEMENAHRNLAIAHMLRSHDILTEDPMAVVEGYIRQCSVLVTTRDLAMMAATLANRGENPLSNEQVVDEAVMRQVLSVMATCGMYDAAGDWATQVGIPAKSGVAGGLIGALPGQLGIATFSPRLDRHGNSVRGVSLFERFSFDMGLHVMEVPPTARAVVRSNRVRGGGAGATRILRLQGGIRFAGAERFVRELVESAPSEPRVILDVSLVHSIDDVARRMLLEVARRLTLDGHEVYLVDPEMMIPDPDPGDGGRLAVIDAVRSHVIAGDVSTGVHRSRHPEQDRPIRRRTQPTTLVTRTHPADRPAARPITRKDPMTATSIEKPDFTGLRAMYINCTLNRSPGRSHTQGLIDRSVAIMQANGVGVDQIRAVDHDIATGVRPDMTEYGWDTDEWPALLTRVLAADILVIAGPIWLGDNSSVTRRVIERLYGYSGVLNEHGQYAYYGRVGGCLLTGNEDGLKHCAMNLLYSLQHIGFTVPPQADAGWLGEVGPGPSYLDEGSGGPENDFTNRNTAFMTYNLLHLASMIRRAGGFPAYGNQRTAWDAGVHPDAANPEYR